MSGRNTDTGGDEIHMREEYLKAHQCSRGKEEAEVWATEGHQKAQVLGGTLLH